MLNDAVDSFFKYVKSRIISKNSQRTVVGIIEANSWPPANVQPRDFYLLLLGEDTPKDFGTISSVGVVHLVQWVWMVEGDDVGQQQVGRNRGNKYRLHYQMKDELIYGLFPYFCDKNSYQAVQQGSQVVTQVTPIGEKIWWSRPRFMPDRFEKDMGLIYGAAQCRVSQFSDQILI